MRDIQFTLNDDVVRVPYVANDLLAASVVFAGHYGLIDDSCGPRSETEVENARYSVNVRRDNAYDLVSEA